MEYFRTVFVGKKQLAADTILFSFDLDDQKEFSFAAGQHLSLIIGEERRLYSIASPESHKGTIELVVKLLPRGVGSNYLRSLELGQPVYFQGPAGVFTLKSADKPKVFMAAGVGIAPVRSLILSFLEKGGRADVYLFWGLRRREDVYFFDDFKALSERCQNFHFLVCLDQEDNFLGLHVDLFKRGRVDKGFLDFVKEKKLDRVQLNGFEYYLCASPEAVEHLRALLETLGGKDIFFDKF